MYQLSYIKFEEVDFDTYHQIVNSDSVMKYILGEPSSLERSTEKFKEILNINHSQEKGGYFKVFHKHQIIGLAKLEIYTKELETLEIGYVLKEEFWGQGFGTQIANDLIHFARNNSLAQNVVAFIDPENLASKKILLNVGFESYFIGSENDKAIEKLRLNL